jgi:hypothetical protein
VRKTVIFEFKPAANRRAGRKIIIKVDFSGNARCELQKKAYQHLPMQEICELASWAETAQPGDIAESRNVIAYCS